MGERSDSRAAEADALRLGLDLGLTLIDTAEMYGDGGAEQVVAQAIAGRRDEVFLVSKVLPHNASREGTLRAAERSLRRLRTDRIDLYLLHWRGSQPLAETYEAFGCLVADGKVLHYGVSNFDTLAMQESERLPAGGAVVVDQVLYNLERRHAEPGLLPWCRDHGVLLMAYSPLEQARLGSSAALERIARRHSATELQIALAWTIRRPGVIAIPKAVHPEHVRQNARAAELPLSEEDLAELDREFPAPVHDGPLGTL